MRSPPKRNGPPGKRAVSKTDWLPSAINTEDKAHPAALQVIDWNAVVASVHDGRKCLGHLLRTHHGFKAINADEIEIGEYESASAARTAIWQAERSA